ncbi:DUF6056 family protein [Bifidobacterium sp. UTBIF-68]|uniref:DUF6056 family protein n=1 Tax=Bifidobacterium sp. UTBIF-68 TaxID=1465262 RepID=UPI00112A3F53|nr:DUF6056 family protein [Bifidobacterium sp. UTBIF-68]
MKEASATTLGKMTTIPRFLALATMYVITYITLLPVVRAEGDDTYFMEQLSHTAPVDWVIQRYMTWSGRIFSESSAAFFLPLPQIAWRLADAGMIVLLSYSLTRITFSVFSIKKLFISYAAVWLIAPSVWLSASYWVAGSFAYLWPAAIGCFSTLLLVGLIRARSVRFWGIYIVAAVLASLGVEQVGPCIVAFGFITVVALYVRDKSFSIPAVVYTLASACALLVELLAPGSAVRNEREMQVRYPEFEDMSFIVKIYKGVIWHFGYMYNYLFVLVFAMAVVAIFIVISGKGLQHKFISIRSCTFDVDYLLAYFVTAMIFIVACASQLRILSTLSVFDLRGNSSSLLRWLLPFAFWIVLLFAVWMLVMRVDGSYCYQFFMISAAIASGALMYFSPTIYASGPRSMFIPSVCLLCSLLHLLDRHWRNEYLLLFGIPAFISILHFTLNLYRNFNLVLFI